MSCVWGMQPFYWTVYWKNNNKIVCRGTVQQLANADNKLSIVAVTSEVKNSQNNDRFYTYII